MNPNNRNQSKKKKPKSSRDRDPRHMKVQQQQQEWQNTPTMATRGSQHPQTTTLLATNATFASPQFLCPASSVLQSNHMFASMPQHAQVNTAILPPHKPYPSPVYIAAAAAAAAATTSNSTPSPPLYDASSTNDIRLQVAISKQFEKNCSSNDIVTFSTATLQGLVSNIVGAQKDLLEECRKADNTTTNGFADMHTKLSTLMYHAPTQKKAAKFVISEFLSSFWLLYMALDRKTCKFPRQLTGALSTNVKYLSQVERKAKDVLATEKQTNEKIKSQQLTAKEQKRKYMEGGGKKPPTGL